MVKFQHIDNIMFINNNINNYLFSYIVKNNYITNLYNDLFFKNDNLFNFFIFDNDLDYLNNIKMNYTSIGSSFTASPSQNLLKTPWFLEFNHLTFWFFFFTTFLITAWLFFFFNNITKNNEHMQHNRETRGFSRSQAGDAFTGIIPMTWSITMLMHANTHSINFDENTSGISFKLTLIAYQWGWSYYFPKDLYNIKNTVNIGKDNIISYYNTTYDYSNYIKKSFLDNTISNKTLLLVIGNDDFMGINVNNNNNVLSYNSNIFNKLSNKTKININKVFFFKKYNIYNNLFNKSDNITYQNLSFFLKNLNNLLSNTNNFKFLNYYNIYNNNIYINNYIQNYFILLNTYNTDLFYSKYKNFTNNSNFNKTFFYTNYILNNNNIIKNDYFFNNFCNNIDNKNSINEFFEYKSIIFSKTLYSFLSYSNNFKYFNKTNNFIFNNKILFNNFKLNNNLLKNNTNIYLHHFFYLNNKNNFCLYEKKNNYNFFKLNKFNISWLFFFFYIEYFNKFVISFFFINIFYILLNYIKQQKFVIIFFLKYYSVVSLYSNFNNNYKLVNKPIIFIIYNIFKMRIHFILYYLTINQQNNIHFICKKFNIILTYYNYLNINIKSTYFKTLSIVFLKNNTNIVLFFNNYYFNKMFVYYFISKTLLTLFIIQTVNLLFYNYILIFKINKIIFYMNKFIISFFYFFNLKTNYISLINIKNIKSLFVNLYNDMIFTNNVYNNILFNIKSFYILYKILYNNNIYILILWGVFFKIRQLVLINTLVNNIYINYLKIQKQNLYLFYFIFINNNFNITNTILKKYTIKIFFLNNRYNLNILSYLINNNIKYNQLYKNNLLYIFIKLNTFFYFFNILIINNYLFNFKLKTFTKLLYIQTLLQTFFKKYYYYFTYHIILKNKQILHNKIITNNVQNNMVFNSNINFIENLGFNVLKHSRNIKDNNNSVISVAYKQLHNIKNKHYITSNNNNIFKYYITPSNLYFKFKIYLLKNSKYVFYNNPYSNIYNNFFYTNFIKKIIYNNFYKNIIYSNYNNNLKCLYLIKSINIFNNNFNNKTKYKMFKNNIINVSNVGSDLDINFLSFKLTSELGCVREYWGNFKSTKYINNGVNTNFLYNKHDLGLKNITRFNITNIVCLPSNINIHLICASKDVIHSWAIPGLNVKIDCIPGFNSHRRLFFKDTGFFFGQCMEVCGRYHHWMPLIVKVTDLDTFFKWYLVFLNPAKKKQHINKLNYYYKTKI